MAPGAVELRAAPLEPEQRHDRAAHGSRRRRDPGVERIRAASLASSSARSSSSQAAENTQLAGLLDARRARRECASDSTRDGRVHRRGDLAALDELHALASRAAAAPDRARRRRRRSSRRAGRRGRRAQPRPAPQPQLRVPLADARRHGRGCSPSRGGRGTRLRDRRQLLERDVEAVARGYAPGATSASPRRSSRRSTPGSATATRCPASARATARSCTCTLRTRTSQPGRLGAQLVPLSDRSRPERPCRRPCRCPAA